MSFLEVLSKKGIIGKKDVDKIKSLAKESYGGDVERALIEFGIPEAKILEEKSEYLGIPMKKLDTSSPAFSEALKRIPEDAAKHYHIAPLEFTDGVLQVGVTEEENTQALDALQFISAKQSIPFKVFLISKSDYESVMGSYKGMSIQVGEALEELGQDEGNADLQSQAETSNLNDEIKNISVKNDAKIIEDAPVIKIVAVILRNAIEGNASDIHIENTGEQVKVRFRVDGLLHTSILLPKNVYAGIVARIKILAKLRLDEKRKPQDGSFSTVLDGRKIDFRVSTMPSYYGEKVVMRILDSEKGVKPLDQLGLSKRNLEMIREAMKQPYGLILITGPTGSGKSTTLYSMMNELDKEESNIVSLEDPIEYHIPDINQSQMMAEIGYTFASGLRSILRQDPDVIMVGEIRDKETAQLAIQAALTGHLVLSTLHTNDAIGAVPRLVDMGIDPYLIAPTLILSIAQRLARLTYPASRKLVPMDPSVKLQIENSFKDLPEEFKSEIVLKDEMYDVVPSPECPSGTRGRVAIFEMFKVNKEMQNVILKSPIYPEIYKVARRHGMLSMKEDATIKALEGVIPYREVFNFANDSGE